MLIASNGGRVVSVTQEGLPGGLTRTTGYDKGVECRSAVGFCTMTKRVIGSCAMRVSSPAVVGNGRCFEGDLSSNTSLSNW